MGGLHNVQLPAGPQSSILFDLWVWMLLACAVVFVMIIAALAIAVWRAPRSTAATPPDTHPDPRIDAKLRRGVSWAVAPCTLMLAALPRAIFFTDRAFADPPLGDPVHIDLVAHQFWWEVRYAPADP